ncbi:class F sortase [Streptomyces sp. NPDC093085]|uniref:class F sortase n=1 Tax=Streptomyces sp. NPDC093085 TaxID=3155068 RepID=UPI00344AC3C8
MSPVNSPVRRPRTPRTSLPALLPALGIAVLLTVTGCSSGQQAAAKTGSGGSGGSGSSSAEAGGTPSDSGGSSGSSGSGGMGEDAATEPAKVEIPSVGISSELMKLGLNDDGTVEVPPAEKGMTAGWYTGNPAPGQKGAAVIIGHNDTRFGKAVFHDLKKITKGAEITVTGKDGAPVRFTVTNTESVSKNTFPTDKVYKATDTPTLRVITCDGGFDAEGHPVNNLIVYAKLAA